jgi:hypothetical protein
MESVDTMILRIMRTRSNMQLNYAICKSKNLRLNYTSIFLNFFKI